MQRPAIPYCAPTPGITDGQFNKILHNSVLGSHRFAQLVASEMVAGNSGVIIFVSSVGGYRDSPIIDAYNLSKPADFQLTRNLAVELGTHSVRVNCIAPGIIRTRASPALWERETNLHSALRGIPLGRIGEPEDIAGAAVFLASAAGRYVTGQSIVIDGGATVTIPGV